MEEPNPLRTNLKCRGWWNCDGEPVAGARQFLLSSVGRSKLGRCLRRRRFVVEREGLIGAEVPDVSLRILRAVVTRAVIGVEGLAQDLRPGVASTLRNARRDR